MSAKYTYNISVCVKNNSHYFGNLSAEKVKIHFDQFMLDHCDGDMFGVFPHEIEFSEDGIPFEDENGEVCDI